MGSPASHREAVPTGLRQRGYAQDGLARGFPFIGGKKATLHRVLGEKGVVLTSEAVAR